MYSYAFKKLSDHESNITLFIAVYTAFATSVTLFSGFHSYALGPEMGNEI